MTFLLTTLAAGARAEETLAILPSQFTLTGPHARQMLLVERFGDERAVGQETDAVTFVSSDPNIVRVEDGIAVPAGGGTATITARIGDKEATANATVEKVNDWPGWSFRNHVQSVLTKAGCNSGACHGAAAGKNGFKLSLRGYDPAADWFTITRQARGRRIVPSDPARSLVLLKPTGAVPHKGGVRFSTDSREYQVLAEWLAAGYPPPEDDDPRLERLEILPEAVRLKKGDEQQLVVRAHFSDGHAEDVTRWAKYTSNDQTVATIDEHGKVAVMGHGEGAIVAWYLSNNVTATVTVPYANNVPAETYASAPRSNFIDELVLAKLQQLNIPPSPPASDDEFIRRAYLDTIGVLPSVEETKRFLADGTPDKRQRVIEHLLTRPEFVDYWTYKWSDLLLLSGERLRPKALDAFYEWIRGHMAANTPWDEFVRRVVLAKGSTYENGAANFYTLHEDPLDMAETTSMAFLGMSIQCAKCHDHPLEKWTNDDYYGMANLFARVRGKGWGGDHRSGDGHRVVFTAERGELIQPRTGRPQPPRPLDGEPIPFDSPVDRRVHVARWLTDPENPYFTKAIVNRVWANFMNVGLVDPVDDMRLTNPPSNSELLDALADFLVENDYDLKRLMRLILSSQTYQRTSKPVAGNEADQRFYARYYPKRLTAEALLDAISQVTGSPTEFKGYPKGTRALQLRDANIASYFLETFGRPERLITCECERSNEPSMKQVLHIMNGSTLNEKLAAKGNRLEKLLAAGTTKDEIIEEAYLAALSRPPRPDEKKRILEVLVQAGETDKRSAIEDLFWSLLSSREFLFNH